MQKNVTLLSGFIALFLLFASCSKPDPANLKMLSQTTGVIATNCYLVYDSQSKEAALIDPGDTIHTLLKYIENEQLNLRYILVTHCHPDHIYGFHTMHLRDKFPEAKVCYSVEELEDMTKIVAKWKEAYPDKVSKDIQESPVFLKLFTMDYSTIGNPDIYLEDKQKLPLGDFDIVALKTPGHAPGSVCFHVNNLLFSGDELIYHAVGGTKTSPVASFEAQVRSIRRLYNELPDETLVYPGHGRSTTIGEEKTKNENITLITAVQ